MERFKMNTVITIRRESTIKENERRKQNKQEGMKKAGFMKEVETSNNEQKHNRFEPAHNETYNKTCDQRKLRAACVKSADRMCLL